MAGGVAAASHRRLTGRRLEVIYRVGVIIKGVDGVVELFAGILLLIAPNSVHFVLGPLAIHLSNGHGSLRHYAGHVASHLDHQLTTGYAPVIVAAFLIAHGVVKIVLVYCLLREYPWVYPYALIVLGLFTVYQIYALIRTPGVVLGLFLALDLVIIWLVWREWRQLRSKSAEKPPVEPVATG